MLAISIVEWHINRSLGSLPLGQSGLRAVRGNTPRYGMCYVQAFGATLLAGVSRYGSIKLMGV